MELEIVIIDNKEYYIMKEITDKDTIYFFLINKNEENDIMIRKAKTNNPNIIIPLDSEEELKKASLLLINKELKEN